MTTQKLDVIFEEEETVEVNKEYLCQQRNLIKQLTQMLKIRLRTELPNSIEIFNTLNERIFNFSEYQHKIEEIYQKLHLKSKVFQECVAKAKKYDELLKRINDIEINYKDKIAQQISTIKSLEQKISDLQNKLDESKSIVIPNHNSPSKDPSIQALKSQIKNLTSLLKQQTEEKEFSQKQQAEMFENKIINIRNELSKVQNSYQEKTDAYQEKLIQLERENTLLKKEIELNQEFTFLQSQTNTDMKELGASTNSLNFSHSNAESPGKFLRSSKKSRSKSGKKKRYDVQ